MGGMFVARKKVKDESNIYYDEERNLYYVSFNYGKDDNGKNIRKFKSYTNIKVAKKELAQFSKDKLKQEIVIPKEDTIGDYFTHYIDVVKQVNCAETTLYGYRVIRDKYVIPYMGDKTLQEIKPIDIENYFLFLRENKLSSTSISKHYALLKTLFAKAQKEKRIRINPFDSIEPVKRQRFEPKFYTPDMLRNLIEAVEGNRLEIVVKLAGLMGMRREEIAGLKWDKIDFENHELIISEVRTQAGKNYITKETKNESSYRKLDIPNDVYELLLKIKEQQNSNKKLLGDNYTDSNYVMAWKDGTPYRPNYVSDLFKAFLIKNNLPHIRLHDLRHTFASIANSMGVPLFDISKALGHSTVTTTSKIYTHSFEKANQKAIKSVSDSLKK